MAAIDPVIDSTLASRTPLSAAHDRHLRQWLPALAAAMLAVVLYAVTVGGTFIIDDEGVARDDPRLQDIHYWPSLFTQPYVPGALDHLWRPLTTLSYAVQHWTTGGRAWPFHVVNVLLYALACAAVTEFARRLAGIGVAWAAGLLFAAHPAHVEPVALVIGRAETLCAAALFIGLCLFIGRALTGKRIIAILVCFIAALLSKETGILMPALLVALLPVARGRAPDGPVFRRQLKMLAAGIFWIVAAYGVFREEVIGFPWNMRTMEWMFNPVVRSTGWDRVLLPVALYGRYLALLFFPLRLSPDYGTHAIGYQVHASDPYLWLGIAGAIAWAALARFLWRRRNWAALFCLFGFALTLLMVLNAFFITGAIFGERLAFLPSAFFLILISMGIARWRAKTIVPLIALLVVGGATRSFLYAREWNDAPSFSDKCFARQPGSWIICDFCYDQHRQRGDWRGALRVAQAAETTMPDIPWPYVRCVQAANKLGEKGVAEEALKAGRKAYPPPNFPWAMIEGQIQEEAASESGRISDKP